MRASKAVLGLCESALALGSMLTASTAAYSQGGVPGYPDQVQAHNRHEVALLPRYCLFTQSFRLANVPGSQDQKETDRWYALMGPTFHAMHHYCWGLMKTNRALLLARDPTTRRFYLNDSIGEFNYVIERAPRDFVLLPEILTKKGENLVRLDMGPLAVEEFQRAIDIKPDYWPPYTHLSDYYKGAGDIQKAREYLERGLSFHPNVEPLRTRLAALEAANTKRSAAPSSNEKAAKPRTAANKGSQQTGSSGARKPDSVAP